VLWIAAGLLWVMDASINVSMEPFRAFVGDQLPPHQRPLGYAMQSFFIGVGAVVASALPWLLAKLGVANVTPAGGVPDTVKYAFYAGGAVLLAAVLWTIATSPEYPPQQLREQADEAPPGTVADSSRAWRLGAVLLALGVALLIAIGRLGLGQELYLLGGGLVVFGLLFVWLAFTRSRGMAQQVMEDLYAMPAPMRRLAWVQFFSWFALFAMWISTSQAVAQSFFGSNDPASAAYNEGANWAGVLFAVYNGVAVPAAVLIPWMVRRWGLRLSHLVNLLLGGAGLLSFVMLRDARWLVVPMVGVGFAWASILSLPYALLSDNLPAAKMGVYMGIFNFFIVIPQLLAASVLGLLLRSVFHGQSIGALALGGASLIVAGLCTLRVREPEAAAALQAA
jgi:maltose/moltooligosaccharide transporter